MQRPPFYRNLYFQVLFAIALGVAVGVIWPERGAAMRPLGDGFIKLIRMLIAPVIFTTIAVGIANMGEMKDVGRIGLRAFIYFEVVSTLALIIGLVVVNLLKPGIGLHVTAAPADVQAAAGFGAQAAQAHDTVAFLLNAASFAVIAVWWTLVLPVLERLAGFSPQRDVVTLPLARKIASFIGKEEKCITDIPGLSLHRRTSPTPPCRTTYQPGIIVVAQGSKQVNLGKNSFIYDEAHYLLTAVDLPIVSWVAEATEEMPCLVLTLPCSKALRVPLHAKSWNSSRQSTLSLLLFDAL
jgi:hypothetical protein